MAKWSNKWSAEPAPPEPEPAREPEKVFRATCGAHVHYFRAADHYDARNKALDWFCKQPVRGYVTAEEVAA